MLSKIPFVGNQRMPYISDQKFPKHLLRITKLHSSKGVRNLASGAQPTCKFVASTFWYVKQQIFISLPILEANRQGDQVVPLTIPVMKKGLGG